MATKNDHLTLGASSGAGRWIRFVAWYSHKHLHSGIGFVTNHAPKSREGSAGGTTCGNRRIVITGIG